MGREIITMLMTMGKEQVNAEVDAHWDKFERKYKTQFTGQERFWEASVIPLTIYPLRCTSGDCFRLILVGVSSGPWRKHLPCVRML